jgi:cytoskeletal protein RodZ
MLEIGESLREARERKRLTYAEIEQATLIPSRYQEALENEAFEKLPEGLYRRSFLREYAAYLGLDGDVYVGEYELRTNPTLSFAPVAEPVPVRPTRRRRTFPLPSLPNATVLLGALLLIAVAAWELASVGGGGGNRATPPPVTRPQTTTAPAQPTTTAGQVERARPASLAITATDGDCWLSVRIEATGKTVLERTIAQGATVRFGLKQPLLIRFGAPSNVTAAIGGTDVSADLPASTSDVVATATGLQPAA